MDYTVWYADDDLWNMVMRDPQTQEESAPFLCARCFMARAEPFMRILRVTRAGATVVIPLELGTAVANLLLDADEAGAYAQCDDHMDGEICTVCTTLTHFEGLVQDVRYRNAQCEAGLV